MKLSKNEKGLEKQKVFQKKCYICKRGNLIKKKIPYTLYGVMVGKYDGEQCDKCEESFYSESVFDEMTEKVKKLGLWGLETRTKLTKVGNSFDIRLNKRLIDFIGIGKGKEVTIIPENKKKIIISLT